MQHKKIIGILTSAAAAVCCVLPNTSIVKEETKAVSASETVSIYDEYLDWSQMDSRWGATPMGGTTIRSSGCLITSLAIMAVHSDSIDSTAMANMGITDIEQFNPGVLADAYTSVGGFSYGGAISSWGTINTLVPQIQFGKDDYFVSTEKTAVAQELKSKMDEGWHIIARVNNGGYHWVYITGVGDDGSITMCDPAMDTHDLYEGYSGGLQGEYWQLKGKNPVSVIPEAVKQPVTTTTTTTTTSPTVTTVQESAPMLDKSEAGEYYVAAADIAAVMSERGAGAVQTALKSGNVINIAGTIDGFGKVISADFDGWIDMRLLAPTNNEKKALGDINGDGTVDKYDLALISAYLRQSEELPDGVSTLCSSELEAADISSDGKVSGDDLALYLKIIQISQEDEALWNGLK
ncbi:MAG: dockerin type I domain-containing protein [Alistipes sp.]|nr:dockerin type I domain-containing protein [Alistipes sp.]